jgi:hypothetical protein
MYLCSLIAVVAVWQLMTFLEIFDWNHLQSMIHKAMGMLVKSSAGIASKSNSVILFNI